MSRLWTSSYSAAVYLLVSEQSLLFPLFRILHSKSSYFKAIDFYKSQATSCNAHTLSPTKHLRQDHSERSKTGQMYDAQNKHHSERAASTTDMFLIRQRSGNFQWPNTQRLSSWFLVMVSIIVFIVKKYILVTSDVLM